MTVVGTSAAVVGSAAGAAAVGSAAVVACVVVPLVPPSQAARMGRSRAMSKNHGTRQLIFDIHSSH